MKKKNKVSQKSKLMTLNSVLWSINGLLMLLVGFYFFIEAGGDFKTFMPFAAVGVLCYCLSELIDIRAAVKK